MGKHFVTCATVFCLLCATHSPCSSHVQLSTDERRIDDSQSSLTDIANKYQVKKPPFERFKSIINDYNEISDNNFLISDASDKLLNINKRRKKRDTMVNKDHKKLDDAVYIKKIFQLFGNGENMNYTGFEQFVRTLHLERLLNNSVDTVSQNNHNNNHANNISCVDDKTLLKSVKSDHKSSENTTDNDIIVDSSILKKLCPIFLYQLVAPKSVERQGCILQNNLIMEKSTVPLESVHHHEVNIVTVWIYSTISILIISACGLLGVLVIPIMQKHIYQHLIQFLVALAVGTLAGDALIHLLPHAMMGQHSHDEHHEHSEEEQEIDLHSLNMWRGFAAMCAMIFFFLMERFLTLGAEWRKRRQLKNNKVPQRVRVMREPENASASTVGEKLCKHKYSSYPYCYDVIATETQDDHHHRQPAVPNYVRDMCDCHTNTNTTTTTILNDLDSETEFLTRHPEANQNLSKCTNNSKDMKCSESNKMLADNIEAHTIEEYNPQKAEINNKLTESSSITVILREHENKHHGHSHAHGHVHSAPKTMSNVVWMVVMGDGLHNFTDGMAIGAAFAGSLAGGFSTAVAVFCHELPHEIGDFAVLLKAGMSAKQAIFYNLLSSILCLFGMILGVSLGKNEAASGWLFAAAAGVFLYIALVDMIPELTTSHSKEGGSFIESILQFMGLITGVAIMLIIALYENDLKQLFEE